MSAPHTPGPVTFDEERGECVMHCGDARVSINALPELLAALAAIAEALDAPRTRFGKLATTFAQGDRLRALRVQYDTPGCRDNIDGSVLVARAAIAKATGSAA